jgi:glycosyltransferase involved in cell wall biosynthesis
LSAAPVDSISVVIPALDAGSVIDRCLDAVLAQTDCPSFDVWVAVGPSTDDTAARVDARAEDDARVHRVENPSGRTPSGLNAAISASDGRLVVRVDAHAQIPAGYLAAVADASFATGAANVGGRQVPVGASTWSCAIATAMTSQFGMGRAAFRSDRAAGPADTVYLGAFRREALEAVGGFDDEFLRNQDYELNWRLRDAGHVVWFDPAIAVEYRPRASLRALASQFWQFGRWKRRMLLANPRSVRLRQLVAPGLIIGLVASFVAAAIGSPLALVVPGLYLVCVVGAALRSGSESKARVAMAFVTMHMAWGTGFLVGR